MNVRILSFGCGVLLTGAVFLALGIIPDSGSAGEGKRECCERFCVTVTPATGGKDTVFRFVGRGWRPNRAVRAVHGPYCEGDCPDIGIVSRVKADRRGRWVFKFRNGPEQPGDREAGIVAGANLSVFEQWKGKPHDSPLVRRKAPHKVE